MNEYFAETLECGLQIIAQPLAGVQSAAFAFFIGAGARDENWDVAGLSHLTESTMFRGTESLSSRDLTERLDALGVERSSSAGIEMTLFSAVQLGDRMLPSLEIFVDVLRRASFPETELEIVRSLQLQEIGQREDQPAQLVMDRARQLFFAGNPISNDGLGSLESVAGLTRGHVVDFWSERYRPNEIVLAVAGSFDWDTLRDTVSHLVLDWPAGEDRPIIPEPAVNPAVHVQERPTAQENMCFIFPGVPYGDDHYYAASLTSLILGGGMNSRLSIEVREKRGLVYSVGARFDGMESTGLFRIYAGTQPNRARETVEVVRSELHKLRKSGVTSEELHLAKARLKSRLVMSSESTGNRAMTIGRDWWHKQRFRSLQQIREEIDAVGLRDVDGFLERIRLTDNLGLFALGPLTAGDLGIGTQAFEIAAASEA